MSLEGMCRTNSKLRVHCQLEKLILVEKLATPVQLAVGEE